MLTITTIATGRGLRQIIEFFGALSWVGWCYLIFSIVVMVILCYSIPSISNTLVRQRVDKTFPTYRWMLTSDYGISISFVVFMVLLCFLGLFSSYPSPLIFSLCLGVPFVIIFLSAAIMELRYTGNIVSVGQEFYIAKYGGLGRFRNVREYPNLRVKATVDAEKLNWEIRYGPGEGKKLFEFKPKYLSEDDQKKVEEFLSCPWIAKQYLEVEPD